MSLLKLDSIVKDFFLGERAVNVLKSVSLTVDRGDYVAIMGPSGSGKSTLLNILGLLDTVTSGHYLLEGTDTSSMSDNQLSDMRCTRIGFVFQSFNLMNTMTVRENVELPMKFTGVAAVERHQRSSELLEKVGLAHRLTHRPAELSGGERQRVAIARALINNPLILLADEPTGNLDQKTGQEILAMFEQLNADGQTIIMVSHDSHFTKRVKRVVHVLDGEIVNIEKGGLA